MLADGVTSYYQEHPELEKDGIALKDLQWAADIVGTCHIKHSEQHRSD